MNFSKFFSNIQESPWYRQFLNPVINEIDSNGELLDIGTGSGKLLQIVTTEKAANCIGVDTNPQMLKEAEIKLAKTNVKLIQIKPNEKLPFKDSRFDYITICNVLFNLNKTQVNFMLEDAIRLLKDHGKIIILSPTGNGNIITLLKNYFSLKNASITIWFYATKNKAKQWIINNYLKQYANERKLKYKSKIVMNGLAQIEIITI